MMDQSVRTRIWADLRKRKLEFLASDKGEFRHNTSFVSVSSLAEQFYCEYKVENEFRLGEISTEAKELGTALHDELVPTEEIGPEEFVRLVSRREPSYAVLRVWGNVAGLRIVGMPDHIVWADGRPLWLVELKTTRGDPAALWQDQENQARIYGLLLDLMGLDCSELRIALVRIRAEQLSEEEKRVWIRNVSVALQSGKVGDLEKRLEGRMKVHMLAHDRRAAVGAVASKSDYWLGKREPTSSTSAGKCRACEYVDLCPKSLAGAPQLPGRERSDYA